jgi:hypothetical protein
MVFLHDRSLAQLQFATPWQSLPPPPTSSQGLENGLCPSWVYKFEKRLDSASLVTKSHEIQRHLMHGVCAGSVEGKTIRCQLNHTPSILTVKGITFSTISSIGERISRTPNPNAHSNDRTNLARGLNRWKLTALAEEFLNRWKPTGLDSSLVWPGDLLEQFGIASVAGVYGVNGVPGIATRHVAHDVDFLHDFAAFILRCKECLGPVDPRLRSVLQRLGPEHGDFNAYMWNLWQYGGQKVLFTTTGGYMGAGPVDTQPGDEVCLLFDCKVPLIIRWQGEHW